MSSVLDLLLAYFLDAVAVAVAVFAASSVTFCDVSIPKFPFCYFISATSSSPTTASSAAPSSDSKSADSGDGGVGADGDDGWHEVDKKNKARLIASELQIEESPIQRLFAGRFRSVLKKQGACRV